MKIIELTNIETGEVIAYGRNVTPAELLQAARFIADGSSAPIIRVRLYVNVTREQFNNLTYTKCKHYSLRAGA